MIDLISIHIPKTAGRSLARIYREVYGEDAVIVFDRKLFKQDKSIAPRSSTKMKSTIFSLGLSLVG